jgi:hypothetical protein
MVVIAGTSSVETTSEKAVAGSKSESDVQFDNAAATKPLLPAAF